MNIEISDKYLWINVGREAETRKLEFFCDGKKFYEMDVKLTADGPDFFFSMDVSGYIGRTVEVRLADTGKEPGQDTAVESQEPVMEPQDLLQASLSLHSDKPGTNYKYRPEIHYTAPAGWINDPNGLVYTDGLYHLYYQWNPYGTVWGNMHWGHAVSRDLMSWEERPTALYPDEYGTMYYGCGFVDPKSESPLMFYYTAAGGSNKWSVDAGNKHTQWLAVSRDGGDTLEKKQEILGHIKGENRDPKVFYHKESDSYIMALYLEENEFAIYRSDDLIHWTESQRFEAEGMWECPNLFKLQVEGEPEEYHWVFWSADGYYMTGSFDGYKFTPESEVLMAYETKLPYAAQTYEGVEDRTILVSWLRTENDRGGYRGMMAIPMELSLIRTEAGLRIKQTPVREFWDSFKTREVMRIKDDTYELKLSGHPAAIVADGGRTIIIIDHGIIECISEDGLKYKAVEAEEDILDKNFKLRSESGEIIVYMM